jgi:hypothetical protein
MSDSPIPYEGELIASPQGTVVGQTPSNPFERSASQVTAAGAVEVESQRAVAEVQAQILVAKRFPRDQAAAWNAIMAACRRPGLAEDSEYRFKRGGEAVVGPTIRLAEEMARCWGNIQFGVRELSRRDGVSEMEVFAWDTETNNRSVQTFQVKHLRDTKHGAVRVSSERDIYEITANMGARRLRARILSVLPADLVDAAVNMCAVTRQKNLPPLPQAIEACVAAFGKIGVPKSAIEKRLGKPAEAMSPAEVDELRGIFAALRDDMSSAAEYFPEVEAPTEAGQTRTGRLRAATKPDASKEKPGAETAQPKPADDRGAATQPQPEDDAPRRAAGDDGAETRQPSEDDGGRDDGDRDGGEEASAEPGQQGPSDSDVRRSDYIAKRTTEIIRQLDKTKQGDNGRLQVLRDEAIGLMREASDAKLPAMRSMIEVALVKARTRVEARSA